MDNFVFGACWTVLPISKGAAPPLLGERSGNFREMVWAAWVVLQVVRLALFERAKHWNEGSM